MNQVPVKWVQKYSLRDGPQPIETGPITFIPVIPLSALRDVVEGLSEEFWQYERTLLEAHAGLTNEQQCGTAIALHWVKKRLLAGLGEVGK